MEITRRNFLRYCGASAAALGLTSTDLGLLEKALANPDAPSVVWLQGAGCYGCSMSFLNRISATAPTTAADVLVNSINLVFHPALMSLAGEMAVAAAKLASAKPFVLVVEGGVSTAFNGAACFAWKWAGRDVTFKDAVKEFAAKAAVIVCVGTCASFGGIPAAPPNPTMIQSVKAATGKSTINIAGCPPHPDWTVWAIVQLLLGKAIPTDLNGRPTQFYSRTVHSQCPRLERDEAERFGVDYYCLKELGCRGPRTRANCPVIRFNNSVNWCIDANAPCIGCTEPTFPSASAFYSGVGRGGGGGTGGGGDD